MKYFHKKANCRLCKTEFVGRTDKIFCSVKCKSDYSYQLNATNKPVTKSVDKILHRNRTILLEIMGKSIKQKKVSRRILDIKKFNYSYITNYHINSKNKLVHYVYDFSWMMFSDQEVLIKRIGTNHPNTI